MRYSIIFRTLGSRADRRSEEECVCKRGDDRPDREELSARREKVGEESVKEDWERGLRNSFWSKANTVVIPSFSRKTVEMSLLDWVVFNKRPLTISNNS